MTKTLYVGNLATETSEDRLREVFSADGRVVETVELATYAKKRRTLKPAKSRGFGFIQMGSEEEAAAALSALHGTEIDGRTIKVGEAIRERNPEPPSNGSTLLYYYFALLQYTESA